jgi:hypothetical protein
MHLEQLEGLARAVADGAAEAGGVPSVAAVEGVGR